MAALPDPTHDLSAEDRATFDAMAAKRSHAEGRAQLGEVYVRMFNNPGIATAVGGLGNQIRFAGVLPDDVRELAILRFAARARYGYEWSHHQRPARQAGLTDEQIAAIAAGEIPADLSAGARAVLAMVDDVVAGRSVPDGTQQVVVEAFGTAGAVEVVALCGLYRIMGDMVTAFDIPLEDGLPPAPF